MTVTILDAETGERRDSSALFPGANTFWWAEGNGSCDCNRQLLFEEDESGEDTGVCLGHHRYVIVATSDPEVPIHSLNQGYPLDVLVMAGVIAG